METRLSPSLLAWLRCFEATARHGSFTRAAGELCITQGAVSQQVKQLEQWLARPLLIRTPRSLVLTPEGKWLGVVLREGFEAIEGTLSQLRRAPRSDGPTTLSCSPSFAMRWLTPRLGSFLSQYPEVGLRVYGEFHALDRTRMVHDGIEVAVRFDPGQYEDVQATQFLDEWLVPVASPAFLAQHPELQQPSDLNPACLLHDASPWDGGDEVAEWTHWFRAMGAERPDLSQGQRFNLSQLALSAALAGQGVAMGRAALVLDDIVTKRLVPLFGRSVQSHASYHFVSQRYPSEAMRLIEAWLHQEAQQFRSLRAQSLPAPSA
ncbi:LysR substrate-binding domain-containing protein [Curvibacter sp. HBC28]|uniref:LysR substrate-binding domain-containing protein n=1 Tax=Curvibacter microcysteis TaxID=3026419 RepID=A0ABT5MEN6_9BURK|nr:LysR substrate-binding domain-containing protein [Curvibacter sp. HBC28]MDD0814367.1 LysR substrate-binding domain-containing protein [Curvibacter sp. HBC28]